MTPSPQIPLDQNFNRPVGYRRDWAPYQASKIMLAQVQQILEEYSEHLPLTVRQIYYRMVAHYQHPKGATFAASLGDLLVNARRAERIPFNSIRDDGIMGGGYWPPDLKTHLRGQDLTTNTYRLDRQLDQDVRLEVWCEAAGMLPQLAKVADEYSVPVYSCGGFNSLTAIRQIAEAVQYEDRDTVVLHLGDYDPSGVSIFTRVGADVAAFVEEDAPGVSFDGVRVALTKTQIDDESLPMDRITTRDSRSLAWIKQGKTHKCELEALAPNLIANTLREHIEDYVDQETRERVLKQERAERLALKSLPSGISFEPLLRKQIRLLGALNGNGASA